MKLTKLTRIITGLLTATNLMLPFLLVALWIGLVFSTMLTIDSSGGNPPPIFFFGLFLWFPAICLVNILHIGLITFYLAHIIKNKEGNDSYRILAGVGLFFLPWLAMPIYFLIYIWPERPPRWALAEPTAVPPVKPPGLTPTQAPVSGSPVSTTTQGTQPQAQPSVGEKTAGIAEQSEASADLESTPGAEYTMIQAPPPEVTALRKPAQKGETTRKQRAKRSPKVGPEVTPVEPLQAQPPEAPEPPLPADSDHTMIGPSPISGEPGDRP